MSADTTQNATVRVMRTARFATLAVPSVIGVVRALLVWFYYCWASRYACGTEIAMPVALRAIAIRADRVADTTAERRATATRGTESHCYTCGTESTAAFVDASDTPRMRSLPSVMRAAPRVTDIHAARKATATRVEQELPLCVWHRAIQPMRGTDYYRYACGGEY